MSPHSAPPDDHSPCLTTAEAARRLAEVDCNADCPDSSNGWPTMLAGTAVGGNDPWIAGSAVHVGLALFTADRVFAGTPGLTLLP